MATSYVHKPSSRSISFRLTAWYAAILAATFLLVGILILLTLRHSITATVDKQLRARLATVSQYVEQEASGPGISHLREELNEDAVVDAASAYLRIADAAGSWIYRSPNTAKWPNMPPDRRGLPTAGVAETLRLNGRPMRVLSAPVEVGIAQIGLPLDEFEEVQEDFIWMIAFGAPLLLCIASVAGYWMSRRAMRPVAQIASTARRITAENLSDRLPFSGNRDELDRLAQVLNEMLAGLDSAFRRTTQFTADASHELRTPMAIIRTTAEVIRGRPRTLQEHDKAWASVLAQTERISQLVDDLLTLTRGDSGSAGLCLEVIDLAPVVTAASSEMLVLADSKGVHLNWTIDGNPTISGDGQALRRLFTILVDNAIKATPAGGRIDVTLQVEAEGAVGEATVTVKDTGIGIPQEDLPHIFDRFYRVSKDRSREAGGAGLGLAIAQWIATWHGGTIQVESQLGSGATFRVILPATRGIGPAFIDSSESDSKLKM